MTLIEKAEWMARMVHKGQTRRDGKTPYISHPQAVAQMVKNDDRVKAVAWLHDVIEDAKFHVEADMRFNEIPEDVIEAVKILTRTKDVPYEEYLKRIKKNDLARSVKVADMLHNLSDKPTEKQKERYTKGIEFLCNG
jgi:(p)ppGpp synthase/HD superfamily hydrolase